MHGGGNWQMRAGGEGGWQLAAEGKAMWFACLCLPCTRACVCVCVCMGAFVCVSLPAYSPPSWPPSHPSASARSECYLERGTIHQKARDYRRAARDLEKSTALDGTNAQVGSGARLQRLCAVASTGTQHTACMHRSPQRPGPSPGHEPPSCMLCGGLTNDFAITAASFSPAFTLSASVLLV